MTSTNEAQGIAAPEDVLRTFTQVMHSEKSSEQLKAAEMMAKYHGLFTPKEETAIRPEVIEAIEAAVREIAQRQEAMTDAQAGSNRAAAGPAGEGGPVVRA